MKKILLTFAAMLSFSATTLAQSITIIDNPVVGEGDDAYEEGQMFLDISSDGKYICGSTDEANGILWDWAGGGEIKYLTSAAGCELRSVSNTGVAAGYDYSAMTYSIDGTTTYLTEQESIGNAITADGTLVVGNLISDSWMTSACYWKNGELTMLPEPTTEDMGFEVSGSSATHVSADGSVIVGYVVDNYASYPLITWTLGEDGTYTANLLSKGQFAADWDDTTSPYATYNPTGISADGKYIAMTLITNPDYYSTIGRYNLETNTLELPEFELNYMLNFITTDIANDGTMIGYCEDWNEGLIYGFIWKAGEASYTKLSSEYPSFTKLAEYDTAGHVPTAISPDGNYILGWGYNTNTYYRESYIIDRELGTTGINSVADTKEVKEVARYTIDGAKISTPTKGLNIVKMSDGTTKKVIVK